MISNMDPREHTEHIPGAAQPMELILIRHGESEANAVNARTGGSLFTGQLDCPLTEKGRKEAEALRGHPLLAGAERYYVSDLLRTRDTAAAFAPPEKTVFEPRLRERSLGEFEGRTEAEVRAEARYAVWFTDPAFLRFRADFTAKAPGGENYTDVCARLQPFLEELRISGLRKAVIVSHAAALRCLMKLALGLSEEETLRLVIPNCVPISIEY